MNNYATTLLKAYSSLNLGSNGTDGTVFGFYTEIAGGHHPCDLQHRLAAGGDGISRHTLGSHFGFYVDGVLQPARLPGYSETFFTNCALNFGIFSTLYPAGAA